jgi:hypothetical protein
MSDTKQLRELALMISRRGQTIYGPESIVTLCNKSGVTLLESYQDDSEDVDPPEALLDFVSRYANISSASRFTVMVLSRLLGVSLPESITKKKVNLSDFLSALPEFFSDLHKEFLGG